MTLIDNKQRIFEADIIRCLFILYIITVRHPIDYIARFIDKASLEDIRIYVLLNNTFVLIALGMFIFISGLLIARRYPVLRDSKERASFIKARIFRIYPLYLLALIIFTFFIVPGPFELLSFAAHIFSLNLLLSPLTGTPIFTLWFVGLIFSYYLLFPVVINSSDRLFRTVILLGFILSLLSLLHKHLGIVDERVIIYLPVFFIGIYCGRNGLMHVLRSKTVVMSSTFILIPSFYYNLIRLQDKTVLPNDSLTIFIVCNLVMISSISPVWNLARLLASALGTNRDFISKIAYYSYCMYLFHRIIFFVLLKLYYPHSAISTLLYLIIAGLPLTLILSSLIQSGYDKFLTNTIYSEASAR
ncbi:MAG: acyltransferase 3 [Nitrospirae bacterium]|nr:MAG: acyltransferase 3 [Nitrospirota bacterium]